MLKRPLLAVALLAAVAPAQAANLDAACRTDRVARDGYVGPGGGDVGALGSMALKSDRGPHGRRTQGALTDAVRFR